MSDTDAGGKQPVKNREWVEDLLERVAPVVEWDRFVVGEIDDSQIIDLYGWIDRDDDYKDFVWTRFWPEQETLEFTTSSDEYSEWLQVEWFGEDSLDEHNECRRVEHAFDIENAVELTEDASIEEFATDGGGDERVVSEWTEMPFTSYERRGNVVEHRVVIAHYGGTGADVRHEYRSPDADSYPSEWTEYEAYELRDHGVRQVQRNTEVLRS